MKKCAVVFGLLLLIFTGLVRQGFADTVQGTLKSVDEGAKKMDIDTEKGFKSVLYTAKTKCPEDVTSPSELVGQDIKVEQDDLLEEALTVQKV